MVKTLCLSVDPYMRCRMNEDTGAAYLTPWPLGEPPLGGGVGKVVQSRSHTFLKGDIVESFMWPWQEFAVLSADASNLNKVGYERVPHRPPPPPPVKASQELEFQKGNIN